MSSTSSNKENLKIEWTKDMILKLIECWEFHENLYNPKHNKYYNKHAKNESLSCIKNELRSLCSRMTIDDIVKKCQNLRSQYNHEKEKIAESKKSGAGTDSHFIPKAYWFNMLYFLDQFIQPRKSKSTIHLNIDTDTTLSEVAPLHVREENVDLQTTEDQSFLDLHTDYSTTLPSDAEPQTKKSKRSSIVVRPTSTPHKKTDESIDENEVMRQASEAIKSIMSSSTRANTQKYSDDVEFFGEYVKSELQSFSVDYRNQIKRIILDAILDLKIQQNTEEYI